MIIAYSAIGYGVTLSQVSEDKFIVEYGEDKETFDNLEEALTMGFSSCIIHEMAFEG